MLKCCILRRTNVQYCARDLAHCDSVTQQNVLCALVLPTARGQQTRSWRQPGQQQFRTDRNLVVPFPASGPQRTNTCCLARCTPESTSHTGCKLPDVLQPWPRFSKVFPISECQYSNILASPPALGLLLAGCSELPCMTLSRVAHSERKVSHLQRKSCSTAQQGEEVLLALCKDTERVIPLSAHAATRNSPGGGNAWYPASFLATSFCLIDWTCRWSLVLLSVSLVNFMCTVFPSLFRSHC